MMTDKQALQAEIKRATEEVYKLCEMAKQLPNGDTKKQFINKSIRYWIHIDNIAMELYNLAPYACYYGFTDTQCLSGLCAKCKYIPNDSIIKR